MGTAPVSADPRARAKRRDGAAPPWASGARRHDGDGRSWRSHVAQTASPRSTGDTQRSAGHGAGAFRGSGVVGAPARAGSAAEAHRAKRRLTTSRGGRVALANNFDRASLQFQKLAPRLRNFSPQEDYIGCRSSEAVHRFQPLLKMIFRSGSRKQPFPENTCPGVVQIEHRKTVLS